MRRPLLATTLIALSACGARTTVTGPIGSGYRWERGEVLRFHVESRLAVDMEGTHPALLLKGFDKPLAWNVEGEFESLVLEVDKDGAALCERRVTSLLSSGHYLDERFSLTWTRGRDPIPVGASLENPMDKYAASLVTSPLRCRVDAMGRALMQDPERHRLVVRIGMMYWPIQLEKTAWISHDEMAMPILHDRLRLSFENSAREISSGTARIVAPVSLMNDDKRPQGYAVSGGAKGEFDIASGRLKSLELDIRIEYSGKVAVPGGGEGGLRVVATYHEIQRLVQ